MIIASRVGRNGGNKSILGSFGDFPRYIRCDIESNISCNGEGIEGGRRNTQQADAGALLRKGNGPRFETSIGRRQRKDSISFRRVGIFRICDGNFLIIDSRSGEIVVIKASPTLLVISQGTFAVTLKITLPAAALMGISTLSEESALAAAWVRVIRTIPPFRSRLHRWQTSVRIASLVVIAVFSSYVMVIS